LSKIADFILIYPICTCCLRWGWPHWNFIEIFGVRKLECLAIAQPFWYNTGTGLGRTDRQTDIWRQHMPP